MNEYLQATTFIDSDHARVQQFANDVISEQDTSREKAVKLYYAVRDQIRYDPYRFGLDHDTYKASHALAEGASYCVPKAILLAAAARAAGIPAAIGLADVKNHLNTEKLRALMGTDTFLYHGYTALYLDTTWVKVTPAFNIELCQRFGVLALEFDGYNNALMHSFDAHNRRHMEYLKDHGWFADFPFDTVTTGLAEYYPNLRQYSRDEQAKRFEDEKPLLN